MKPTAGLVFGSSRPERAIGPLCLAAVFACVLTSIGPLAGGALAQNVGCQGQNASGSQSAQLASRVHQDTLEKAKSAAGIGVTPLYAGVAFSASQLDHDGYRLKSPVPQNGCQNPGILLTELEPFETRTYVVSALGEADLTRSWRLPEGYTLRVGTAIGYKSLETKTSDIVSFWNPGGVAGDGISTNLGPSRLEEDGVQFDSYALITQGATYAIVATSFGFGDSDISYTSIVGPAGATVQRGETEYRDYTVSATLGYVFTLAQGGNGRWLADLSGALIYTAYNRDGFIDTAGGIFGDAETDEFAGKGELKIAYQNISPTTVSTVYVKGGVYHRFVYDSTYTTARLGPPAAAVPQRFDLDQDDTVGIVGGGLSYAFDDGAMTAILDGTYNFAGDSDELIGKAQLIFKIK